MTQDYPHREVSDERIAEIKQLAKSKFEGCSIGDLQQMVIDMLVAWDKLDWTLDSDWHDQQR